MGLVVPLLLTLGVLLALRFSRKPLRSKTWVLLRSLLPSWRFFEDVEPGPELSFRVVLNGAEPGPWRAALTPPHGSSLPLVNARGNLHLAAQSLVEQLEAELDGVELELAPQLVPYRLVQRLVEMQLRRVGLGESGTRYQFRIGDAENGFVSAEHAL
jgi:hypothetical protein